jgi:hypothetical protein
MKTAKYLFIALSVLVFFNSCQKIKGKGDVVSETRSVSGFSEIDLGMSATVYLTNGDTNSLQVLAQENLLPYIQTNVNNGRLEIKVKHGFNLGNHEPMQVIVTAPGVTSLAVSGSGKIIVENQWNGTTLETSISGSGDTELSDVQCGTLKADISGSGSIRADGGQVSMADMTISGSGNIDFRNIVAWNADADISGSGDIYTQVNNQLDATISGSGNIYYLGNPQINVHISGSGNILKL